MPAHLRMSTGTRHITSYLISVCLRTSRHGLFAFDARRHSVYIELMRNTSLA